MHHPLEKVISADRLIVSSHGPSGSGWHPQVVRNNATPSILLEHAPMDKNLLWGSLIICKTVLCVKGNEILKVIISSSNWSQNRTNFLSLQCGLGVVSLKR
jgi:hypothetical protein